MLNLILSKSFLKKQVFKIKNIFVQQYIRINKLNISSTSINLTKIHFLSGLIQIKDDYEKENDPKKIVKKGCWTDKLRRNGIN